MTTKRVYILSFVLCISFSYALLFHTTPGLHVQYWLVYRYDLQKYGRFLVPWLLQKNEFRQQAAEILVNTAGFDLYRARELFTALISEHPNAYLYCRRGRLYEMWHASSTNALHDYEAALCLKLDGKDGNMAINIMVLSNICKRVRSRINAENMDNSETGR